MPTSDLKESVASKKLWFAIFAVVIGFCFSVLAAWKLTELKTMFDSFTGLIEFVTAAYLTGNIANKAVVGFHAKNKDKQAKDPQPKATGKVPPK